MGEELNGSNNERPLTYDRLKKQKQPTIKKCRIVTDAEVDFEYRAAEQEWGLAQIMFTDEDNENEVERLKKAEARFNAAKETAMGCSVEFKFRSIGRKAFSKIIDEHPPTAKQLAAEEDVANKPEWNVDTFPQALVAAASVSPRLTEAETEEMWDSADWSMVELNDLFSTAIQAQNTRRLIEAGNV